MHPGDAVTCFNCTTTSPNLAILAVSIDEDPGQYTALHPQSSRRPDHGARSPSRPRQALFHTDMWPETYIIDRKRRHPPEVRRRHRLVRPRNPELPEQPVVQPPAALSLLESSHYDHGRHSLSLRSFAHRNSDVCACEHPGGLRHPPAHLRPRSAHAAGRIRCNAAQRPAVTKLVRQAGLEIEEELLADSAATRAGTGTGRLLIARIAPPLNSCYSDRGSVLNRCAPVAQLDRATDYESVGREFESLRAHH